VNDADFLLALENCELPESEFGHLGHVRAAYLYLLQADFPEALARISRAIRNYAAHLGKPDRYHQTVTVAYVALIAQHIFQRGHGGGWTAFASENPELLQPGLLRQFYSSAQLESDFARRVFLLSHSTSVENVALA
jgi:hypothetical protein